MIQLVAYTQSGGVPVNLDVAEGTSVRLNFQFANPGEPLTRQSPYSGAFTLPFTPVNNRFFGHYYAVDLGAGTFSAETRTRVEVRSDGLILTDGFLQLHSVSLTAMSYEVNVLGTAGELFNKLNDVTLTQVLAATASGGAGDYEYQPTAANVISSWNTANDITNGDVGAGVVVVPLADYGNTPGGRLFYDYGVTDGLKAPNYLQGYHLKPAMKVSHIISKCFEYAGMTLNSTFLSSSPMTELYMLLGTSSKDLPTRPYYGSRVGLTADVTCPNAGSVTLTGWTAAAAGNYDPDGHMSTYGFVAPADMTALFQVSLCVQNYTSPAVGTLRLVRGGAILGQVPFQCNASGSATIPVAQLSAQATLLQGEYVEVVVVSAFSTGSIVVNQADDTYFKFVSYATVNSNTVVAVLDGLPQVKAGEFLKELVERFNLAVVSDLEDDRSVTIEPMNDYLLTGAVRDWTGTVNREAPMVLSPLSTLRKKRLHYTDGVDADYLNQYHQNNFGTGLGDYGWTSSDEFAVGDLTTPTLCGSTAMHPITTSNVSTSVHLTQVSIPTYYGTNDAGEVEVVATKPKLLFYNNLQTIVNPIYVGAQQAYTYPHFSPFTTRVIGPSTWSVYWRHTFTFSEVVQGEAFAQGLYERFWAAYMTDLYDAEARMLDCEVVLSAADVRQLSFADIIEIDNQQYRVLSVSNYNPDGVDVAQVRLLRSLGKVARMVPGVECDLVLVTRNANGTTAWEDAAGTPASPTEACCESEGYYWDGTSCWWKRPTGGGGGTDTSTGFSRTPGQYIPPRTIPTNAAPIRIPVPRTTATEITSMPTGLFPYADGVPMNQTANLSGYSVGAHQRYLLCATTTGRVVEVASPRGVLDNTGNGESSMVLRDGMTAHIRARCVGVDVATSSGTGVGDYLFEEKLFVVQNLANLVRTREDHTLDRHISGGRNNPTISMRAVVGTDVTGGATTLELTLDGHDEHRITSWLIDVDMTLVDTGATAALTDSLVHENMVVMVLENNVTLVQG